MYNGLGKKNILLSYMQTIFKDFRVNGMLSNYQYLLKVVLVYSIICENVVAIIKSLKSSKDKTIGVSFC